MALLSALDSIVTSRLGPLIPYVLLDLVALKSRFNVQVFDRALLFLFSGIQSEACGESLLMHLGTGPCCLLASKSSLLNIIHTSVVEFV